jgi:hypothetical protein
VYLLTGFQTAVRVGRLFIGTFVFYSGYVMVHLVEALAPSPKAAGSNPDQVITIFH